MSALLTRARVAATCLSLAASAAANNEFVTRITLPVPVHLDGFGRSLSMRGDTLLVGTPHGSANALDGRALLFTRQAGQWHAEQELIAPLATRYAGLAVALGTNMAAISGFTDAGDSGVWIFEDIGSGWILSQELLSNATILDRFGQSLAMSGDTLVIGAPATAFIGEEAPGSAHLFQLVQGSWERQAVVNGDFLEEDSFGASVAIQGDTVLIGSPSPYFPYDMVGAAFVFVRSGTDWALEARLEPDTSVAGYLFGRIVAIDGDLAVVGGEGAFTFRRSGGSWTQEAQLQDDLQRAVATAGGTVVVANDGLIGTGGSARVLLEVDGAHHPQARLFAPEPESGQYFGVSVAIEGGTIAVGAVRSDAANLTGAVYIFEQPVGERRCTATANSSGAPATAYARGTASLQANNLELAATPVPDKPGLFFAGTNAIQAPFGPAYRCVGGSVLRLRPGVATDGILRKPLDLSTGSFAAGSTWHFQAWFRDRVNGTNTFNTSSSLSITFAP